MRAPKGWTIVGLLQDSLREGAEALQGTQLKGAARSAVLDSALIVDVAGVLKAIRRQVPELKDAVIDGIPANLTLALTPALGARVRSIAVVNDWGGWTFPLRDGVPATGVVPFDSLGRLLRANDADLSGSCQELGDTFCHMHLYFSNYINGPVVAAAYARILGVKVAYARPDDLTFVSAKVDPVDESEQQWLVTFVEGKGDCPAGCTSYITTVVRYDRKTHASVVDRRRESRYP